MHGFPLQYGHLQKEVPHTRKMETGKFLQWPKGLLSTIRDGFRAYGEGSGFRIEEFGFESVDAEAAADGNNELVLHDEDMLAHDAGIAENRRFTYPVFIPDKRGTDRKAILLLHGLNERNWDKYLHWAEYLTLNTGKPVILFPIAFHMNRGPSAWLNPRSMNRVAETRRKKSGNPGSLTFANAVLSERLTEKPLRFYHSGRQTIRDISALARHIGNGEHPLFPAGTTLDLFAYSIGSFLAEILLMANPGNLFSSSKLFIFCGGAIFRHMYGESKHIMDKVAYERLLQYYCEEWFNPSENDPFSTTKESDDLARTFSAMISPDIFQEEREHFFDSLKRRISGISLLKDKVMPFSGVEACMGKKLAGECFELLDFPFEYSHETPFPATGRTDLRLVEASFREVFRKSAAFLA